MGEGEFCACWRDVALFPREDGLLGARGPAQEARAFVRSVRQWVGTARAAKSEPGRKLGWLWAVQNWHSAGPLPALRSLVRRVRARGSRPLDACLPLSLPAEEPCRLPGGQTEVAGNEILTLGL